MLQECSSYCWQAGWNPGFTGPPEVRQISLSRVQVDWTNVVKNRDCADQLLVKYWPRANPNKYKMTDLLPTDADSVAIEVTPKIFYQFQAVAREDKGPVLGIEWNKSPVVEFKTSAYNKVCVYRGGPKETPHFGFKLN